MYHYQATGIKSIKVPHKTLFYKVDFHRSLPVEERDLYLIPKGEGVTSGDTNGLRLHIDTESYNHGYVASAGAGVSLVVHHHGDQPILGSGTIKLMVGFLGIS